MNRLRCIEWRILEGEQIAARFVLVPPRMERICARSRHGTSGRHLEREERRTTLREEKQLLMLSYALRRDDGHYKSQVFRFPCALPMD